MLPALQKSGWEGQTVQAQGFMCGGDTGRPRGMCVEGGLSSTVEVWSEESVQTCGDFSRILRLSRILAANDLGKGSLRRQMQRFGAEPVALGAGTPWSCGVDEFGKLGGGLSWGVLGAWWGSLGSVLPKSFLLEWGTAGQAHCCQRGLELGGRCGLLKGGWDKW